jgi:hypothetical protein
MAVTRSLILPAALVSACAAIHSSPRAPLAQGLRPGGGREVEDHEDASTKTMPVKGHTVSEVSASWTGKVVYAIFTSAIPKYHEALLTQLDTWAARPASQGRYVAVGGKNYPEEWQGSNVLRSECRDDMDGISCKEATLLAECAARGADWLLVTGEDNYVQTSRVEEFLSDKDPDAAIAFGDVRCGTGLYCRDSEVFERSGGFCGGSGYIISRAALHLLLADGAPGLHAIYDNSTWPNDMTTSCALRKRDVRLENATDMLGWPIFGITDYERVAHSGFLTAHYIMPPVMRWLHAVVEGAADSVRRQLEEKAFDHHGCPIGMDQPLWARAWAGCQASEGGRRPNWR